MRQLMAFAILAATAVPSFGAQEPGPRVYLLFVDDLHLDFRQTPRTRALMQQVLARLGHDGDLCAVVTTGTSSISLPPTADLAAVRAAVSRVTGNQLHLRERLGPGAAAESRRRADIAYATAVAAITRLGAAPNHGDLTVVYLSGGYDTRVVAPPTTVIEAAARAHARVIPIWPWTAGPEADVPLDAWNAYVTATQDALRTLAMDTSGMAVLGAADLEPALQLVEPKP